MAEYKLKYKASEIDSLLDLVITSEENVQQLNTTVKNIAQYLHEKEQGGGTESDLLATKEYVNEKINEIPQADWDQNDETQPDYIKNRLAWVEYIWKNTEIIPKTELTTEYEDDTGYSATSALDYYIPLPENENNYCKIIWNNQTYDCKIFYKTYYDKETDFLNNYIYIGNLYLRNEGKDTKEPFLIYQSDTYDETYMVVYTDAPQTSTLTLYGLTPDYEQVHKIDKKFLPLDELQQDLNKKLDKNNPKGTGSLSLNRKAETSIGSYSVAEGHETTASGYASHAEGNRTTASGNYGSHAEGTDTVANGSYSHAEGLGSQANNAVSHAEGEYTIAKLRAQHVQGKYNVASNDYAHIVGWGESDSKRKNIHTIDTKGNAEFAGKVTVGDVTPTAEGDLTSKGYVDEKYKFFTMTYDHSLNMDDLIAITDDAALNTAKAKVQKVWNTVVTNMGVIENGTATDRIPVCHYVVPKPDKDAGKYYFIPMYKKTDNYVSFRTVSDDYILNAFFYNPNTTSMWEGNSNGEIKRGWRVYFTPIGNSLGLRRIATNQTELNEQLNKMENNDILYLVEKYEG